MNGGGWDCRQHERDHGGSPRQPLSPGTHSHLHTSVTYVRSLIGAKQGNGRPIVCWGSTDPALASFTWGLGFCICLSVWPEAGSAELSLALETMCSEGPP